jgi:hypothetical protein
LASLSLTPVLLLSYVSVVEEEHNKSDDHENSDSDSDESDESDNKGDNSSGVK